jgi:uncharacterized protein
MGPRHRIGAYISLVLFMSSVCWILADSLFHQGLYARIWGAWYGIEFKSVLALLGNITPGVVALALLVGVGGNAEIRRFWRLSVSGKVSYKWYLYVLVFPWLIFAGAALAGSKSLDWLTKLQNPSVWCLNLVVNLPFGPLWEEVGWRGYLLRALQDKRNGLESSMIVGVVWGVWHIPMYLSAPPNGINAIDFLVEFCLYTIGLSIVFTWVYNKTRGSIIPVVVLHASLNATSLYILDPSISINGSRPILWATAFVWLTSLIILGCSGTELGCNRSGAILSSTAEQGN